MARKKEEGDMEATAETRAVRLELDSGDHRLLRLLAADAEVSMAAYARDVMQQHLRAQAKQRGISIPKGKGKDKETGK